jgi:hypothetical protein
MKTISHPNMLAGMDLVLMYAKQLACYTKNHTRMINAERAEVRMFHLVRCARAGKEVTAEKPAHGTDKSPMTYPKWFNDECDALYDETVKTVDALKTGEAVKHDDPEVARFIARMAPLLWGRRPVTTAQANTKKVLTKSVDATIIGKYQIPGLGSAALGQILGETGELGTYGSIAALWKRMGLGIDSVDGSIQGRLPKGVTGEAATEAWIRRGYCPRRRSIMYIFIRTLIADYALPSGKVVKGHYADVHAQRKELELAKGLTKGHAHNRAGRWVSKRLLRDLWQEWRRLNELEIAKSNKRPAMPKSRPLAKVG